jgi:hypothetical protein
MVMDSFLFISSEIKSTQDNIRSLNGNRNKGGVQIHPIHANSKATIAK